MRQKHLLAALLLSGTTILAGCGTMGTSTSSSSTGTQTGSILGDILSAAVGTGTTQTSTSSSANGLGTLIGSILGSFSQQTSSSSIVGTWVYSKPAVQFESDNLLAKAGGTVASNTVVSKLEPYYQKVGITAGKFTLTLNSDKTCTYELGGNTYSGTYTYNSSSNTVTIQGALLTMPTAYISVSGNQMALTFDSSKLLSIAQKIGSSSSNSTVSQISQLSTLYDGMKTGFLFNKK